MHVQSWLVSLFMDCPPNFGITCPSYEEVEVSQRCAPTATHENILKHLAEGHLEPLTISRLQICLHLSLDASSLQALLSSMHQAGTACRWSSLLSRATPAAAVNVQQACCALIAYDRLSNHAKKQDLLPRTGVMRLHVMVSSCWLSGVHGGGACRGHLLARHALQHPGGATGCAPAAVCCRDDA